MRGELRAEETFASIRAEPATSPAPVQPFFLKHARLVASGAVRPKSLDLKLEHHSTHRLFCLVAHFNGKFNSSCFDDQIFREIKQRLSCGFRGSLIVWTLDPFVILGNSVATPDIRSNNGPYFVAPNQ